MVSAGGVNVSIEGTASMRCWILVGLVLSSLVVCLGQTTPSGTPPGIGKVDILRSSELKPGMRGVAWTVFEGAEPEAMPVEVIGLLKNALGPQQDLVLAKLGGRALRTNVAGGMSGSPVYIDGKLAGAISRRVSVFSPEAICGITPVDLMMEVAGLADSSSTSADSRAPSRPGTAAAIPIPSELLARVVAAGSSPELLSHAPALVPIEAPLVFAGFREDVLRDVSPVFQQLGAIVAQGGGGSSAGSTKPAEDWRTSLRPGQGIAGLLVSGDLTVAVQGTVTYNDGRRVLAFGHSMQNFGEVDIPMGRSEVLMTMASSYQPNKLANAGEIVGAIRQDRAGGIAGLLGEEASTIPMQVNVRYLAENGSVRSSKTYRFNVFVNERFTPTLIMTALYNTLSGMNEFSEANTYRLNGKIELDGGSTLSLATMQAPGDSNTPVPMQLAGWVGDRFNRLFLNSVTLPRFRRADVNVDLLPERRVASIENAWAAVSEAEAGETVHVKVFLRPFRGERLARDIEVKLPAGLPPGQHRILLSDADTLNRMQSAGGRANRFMGLDETISLINQERTNNQLYVSLLQTASTVYYDDKTMPSLPASALNVLQAGPMAGRPFASSRETVIEQAAVPFDYVVSGSYSLTITVK
jgi:hypothetical protein